MPTVSPLGGFSPEIFARRRQRVLERLEGGALVLPAAPLLFRSRDTEHPYRPDSELFWVTGVAEPDAVAVLRGHADEERFVLFVRERDAEAELWSGPRMGPDEAAEVFGADRVRPLSELEAELPGLLTGSELLYYRLDDRTTRVQRVVVDALARGRARGARAGTGPRGVVDPGEALDDLRLVKDPEELERMRGAAAITVAAFRSAVAAFRPGMGEWEVQAHLDGAFRAAGGDGPAYETIVGSGARACVLHYVANGERVGDGDLVLVDAGASLGLYAADLTRTFPSSGCFSSEQRALYDVVEGARAAAVASVRPQATVEDVHRAALDVLVGGLVELGLLEGPVDDMVASEAYKPFYPHRTSHWLGLDVHDVGDYARGGRPRTLEAGMVLTVEPGLYVSPAGPGGGTPFAGTGVRLEDDVLVTAGGCENLTEGMPSSADAVAALVGSGA